MIIIKAYKNKVELTQSQKDVLLETVKRLKILGYAQIVVDAFTPLFSEDTMLEYIAIKSQVGITWVERAYIGKRGGLSYGLGENNNKGFDLYEAEGSDYILENTENFEIVNV